MSDVSSKLEHNFSAQMRTRGGEYRRSSGLLQIIEDKKPAISFRVRGNSIYEVILTLGALKQNKYSLHGECDCPYFYQNDICKHIWSAIVASEGTLFGQNLSSLTSEQEFINFLGEETWGGSTAPVVSAPSILKRDSASVNQARRRSGLIQDLKLIQKNRKFQLDSKKIMEQEFLKKSSSEYKEVFFEIDRGSKFDSGLLIKFLFRNRTRNGDMSKFKSLKVNFEGVMEFQNPMDRSLLVQVGLIDRPKPGHFRSHVPKIEFIQLGFERAEQILPMLCQKRRLVYKNRKDEHQIVKTALEKKAFLKIKVEWSVKESCWILKPKWQIDEELFDHGEGTVLSPGGLTLIHNSHLCFVEMYSMDAVFERMIEHPLKFKKSEKRQLEELLLNGLPKKSLIFEEGFFFYEEKWAAKPIMSVEVIEYKKLTQIVCTLKMEIEEKLYAPLTDERPGSDVNPFKVRDVAGERQVIESIFELKGLEPYYEGRMDYQWLVSPGEFVVTVAKFLEMGIEVMAQGHRVVSTGTMNSKVMRSGVDWFEINVEIEFEGQTLGLPEILKSQSKNGFVQLGDGTLGVLPTEWLEKQKALSKIGMLDGERLRIHKSQALFLDELLRNHKVEFEQSFVDVVSNLRNVEQVEALSESSRFQGELRSYQRSGLGWFKFLWDIGLGGCLADEMGLGKTVQVLAHLDKGYGQKKTGSVSLIVAPKSLIFNWKNEAQTFTPHLSVGVYEGPQSERRKMLSSNKYQILLCTYGILKKDIEILKDIDFQYVILDEAQAIKNPQSLGAKVCYLLKASHRLALTGTPIENRYEDLFSIFNFLIPGVFSRKQATGNSEANEQILKAIRPFILRRTKEKVLTDLPEKTESILYCEMSSAHKDIYDEMRDYYRDQLTRKAATEGFGKTKIKVLEALLRLRQIACHPELVDARYHGEQFAKVELLLEKLRTLLDGKRKVLIFSQFVQFLKILGTELSNENIEYSYLDGQSRARNEIVEEFKKCTVKNVFLISLKAGGVGLNLTEADYCFILDPWWNPAVESQAIDRIHRIGQKNPVFAYKMITKGTVEEKILKLQSKKAKMADDVFSQNEGLMKKIDIEDLEYIFS